MSNYENAVKAATTQQGYDPVIAALRAFHIPHTVEQTGGFTMCVVIPAANGGVYAVSSEAHDDVLWLCYYPGNTWHETGEAEHEADHTLESLITFLAPLGQTEDEQVVAAVERSKREITADIVAGTLPTTVSTFSELHDYVDANCYGGLCDGVIDLTTNVGMRVQEQVHQWLAAGRPR